MIVFIVSIVFCIVNIMICFLSTFLFFILSTLLKILGYLLVLVSLFLVFIFKDKKNKSLCLIGSFILILFSLFGGRFQGYLNDRNEVNKYLKEHFTEGYKIKGIHDSKYGERGARYNYSFDVEINDNYKTNIVAKNADTGTEMTHYSVVTDYISNYLPKYYEDYKNSNNITFTMENIDSRFTIKYTSRNKEEVITFINSAFDDIKSVNFCFYFENSDGRHSDACSWRRNSIHLY